MAERLIIIIVQLAVGGWIDLQDLCHVDSSLCQQTLREIFLAELVQSLPMPGIVELWKVIWIRVTHQANFVHWLCVRDIAVHQIDVIWDACCDENLEGLNKRLAVHLGVALITLGKSHLSGPCDIFLKNFAGHFSNFPALRTLHLTSAGTITAQTLSALLVKCTHLQHITLERSEADRTLIKHRCPFLEKGESFNLILKDCPNLKSMHFKSSVPYLELQRLLKKHQLVTLTLLDVGPITPRRSNRSNSEDPIDLSGLNVPINFSGLQKLKLRMYHRVLQPLLTSILNSDTSRLTDLRICSGDDAPIAEMIDGITRQCPQLTALSYKTLPGLTFANTIHIAEQLTALCSLTLPFCSSGVRDETIMAVIQHCRSLTYLNVSHCENISDRGVLSIQSDRITVLGLAELPLITDESIVALLTTLTPNLQYLDVLGCDDLTEAIYEPILNGTAPVSLRYCWLYYNVDDYSEDLERPLEAVNPTMLSYHNRRKIFPDLFD